MLKIKSTSKDLLRLLFPASCIDCGQELSKNENQLCVLCKLQLPYTDFEKYLDNSSLDQKFWGRVPLESTFALCYFESDKGIQSIVHELKYKHNQAIGIQFGKEIAQRIKGNPKYEGIEALVPVPLHHRKKFVRGFNQTEILAQGFQKVIDIPIELNLLKKTKHTQSQTKNNRFFRWEQAKEQFEVKKLELFPYQHIAILDDVITTGSTLEGLILKIKEVYPHLKISVLCLATVR